MSWMTSCRRSNSLHSTQPTSSVRRNLVQRRQWRRAITIRDQGGKGRMPGRKWERIPPFTSYSKAAFCFSPPFPPYPFKSEEEEERERRFISLMQQNDGGEAPPRPFANVNHLEKRGRNFLFCPFPPFLHPQSYRSKRFEIWCGGLGRQLYTRDFRYLSKRIGGPEKGKGLVVLFKSRVQRSSPPTTCNALSVGRRGLSSPIRVQTKPRSPSIMSNEPSKRSPRQALLSPHCEEREWHAATCPTLPCRSAGKPPTLSF